MMMAQTLQSLMTTNVETVSPQQTVQEAAQLMKQCDVGAIPVVENGQLRGIITDRDIALRSAAEGISANTKVAECMSTDIVTASSNTDVHEAARLMAECQIRRLPVVDNNQMVGIVAIGDFATTDIYENEAGEALSSISIPSNPKK